MVFESLIADLVNRFAGDYLENLDAKQLNLGVFGGDINLTNVQVKASALDALDLPVKLKLGFLANLQMKVPWRDLYNQPVEVTVDGLYILVVPNIGVKYDAVKETKQAQDAKQKELDRLEELRKIKRKGKPEEKTDDSFVEKTITQVIKNLQVTVRNIHIRYEDEFTNRSRPFAAGVTLSGLTFQTTDANWQKMVIKEAVTMFHKMIDLNSLSLYWNSDCTLLSRLNGVDEIKNQMIAMISSNNKRPDKFSFMLEPINMQTKLKMVPKPERDQPKFYRPKISLKVEIEQIGLRVAKYQYQDLLESLESVDRMAIAGRYRKYRPPADVKEYKGNYRTWWKFAYTCILEDQIRRKRRNWSWQNIVDHRKKLKRYKLAYVEKLTQKNPSKETVATITSVEQELDVFNLNVVRQSAELEIDRKGLTRVEDQQGFVAGWVSWAWGSGAGGSKDPKKGDDIASKFEDTMTDEEKQKFYAAIDYQENAPPPDFPKEFIAVEVGARLGHFTVAVDDNINATQKRNVVNLDLSGVNADFQQRPGAEAVKVDLTMSAFKINGMPPGEKVEGPAMITMKDPNESSPQRTSGPPKDVVHLLAVHFETHPPDGSCDQLIRVRTHPLMVLYHAATVNQLAVVFRPPEAIALKQMTATAMAKYEEVKERSATGLEFALEKRSIMHLDIELQPTRLVIPEKGVYSKEAQLLVLNMGTLTIKTEGTADGTNDIDIKGKSEEERYKILMEKAYDKFKIELNNLQVLYVKPGQDWKAVLARGEVTPMHMLKPTGMMIALHKATIEDSKLPKIKIAGHLPDLNLTLSDRRLLEVSALAASIPTPPPPPVIEKAAELETVAEPDARNRAKMMTIMESNEVELAGDSVDPAQAINNEGSVKRSTSQDIKGQQASMVNVELSMVLNEVSVNLMKADDDNATNERLMLRVAIQGLGVDLRQRAMDMTAKVYLKNVELQHAMFKSFSGNGPLYIIENELRSAETTLLTLEFNQVDKKNPFFASDFDMTEVKLETNFEALTINLHQEALVDLQRFANKLTAELAKVKPAGEVLPPPGRVRRSSSTGSGSNRRRSISESLNRLRINSPKKSQKPSRAAKKAEEQIINVRVIASLQQVKVVMGNTQAIVSNILLRGLKADIAMRKRWLELSTSLQEISIFDPSPDLMHPKILSVAGDKVFQLEFMQFNRSEEERRKMTAKDVDMSVRLRFTQLRFVFLNLWLNKLLCFVAPFQQVAAEAAASAGAAASENAAAAAQELVKQAPRIKLDIEIAAPLIYVPQKSTSDEALVADFGRLCVKSHTVSYKVPNSEVPATIDNLSVELSQLKLARVVLDLEMNVVAEAQILEPVSFSLEVNRNMSFDFYKEVPEINVKAKIPKMALGLSQEDYRMTLALLSGNLAEGTPPPPAKQAIRAADVANSDQVLATITEEAEIVSAPPVAPPDANVVRITFTFELEGITASLYLGSSGLTTGVVERDASKALARVQLLAVLLQGRVMADNATQVHLALIDFIIDDARQNVEGVRITRLMEKRVGQTKDGKPENMIDITFAQKGSGDQNAVVRMRPFCFCVCAEFLAALAVFFTPPPAEPVDDASTLTTPSSPNANKPMYQGHVNADQELTSVKSAPKPEKRKASFVLKAVIDESEIMILEQAKDLDQIKALIITFGAKADIKSLPEHDYMSAALNHLQIYSTYYDVSKRSDYRITVLAPMDISLISNKRFAEGQQVYIEITHITIKVSPAIIALLSGVAASFSEQQQANQKELQSHSDKRRRKKHDVWRIRLARDCRFPFMQNVAPAEEADAALAAVPDLESPDEIDLTRRDQLTLKMEQLQVSMEAGVGTKTIPLIFLTVSCVATVTDWSAKMIAEAEASLQLSYYNEQYNVWEPLLEPVPSERGNFFRPYALTAKAQKFGEFDVGSEDEVDKQPPEMEVRVTSPDTLQLTVTKSCLSTLNRLGETFSNAAKQSLFTDPDSTVQYDGVHDVMLKNECGFDIVVSEPESSGQLQLTVGGTLPLRSEQLGIKKKAFTDPNRIVCDRSRRSDRCIVNARFPALNTSRELDITRAGHRFFPLHADDRSIAAGDGSCGLVVETKIDLGVRIVTLRSPIQVKNALSHPVEIHCANSNSQISKLGVIEPQKSFNVPIRAIYSEGAKLYFTPQDSSYNVSSEAITYGDLVTTESFATILTCGWTQDETYGSFMRAYAVKEELYCENRNKRSTSTGADSAMQSFTIHLEPPVTFHNMLPWPVTISPPATPAFDLASGEGRPIHTVKPGEDVFQASLTDFQGRKWNGDVTVERSPDELSACSFESARDRLDPLKMDLAMHSVMDKGALNMTLYCPFWMVNKTGKKIFYTDPNYKSGTTTTTKATKESGGASENGGSTSKRQQKSSKRCSCLCGSEPEEDPDAIVEHLPDTEKPVLFTFSGKSMFQKKSACLKIENSKWSDKFPIDVVGNAGRITCKCENGTVFEATVTIQMSYSGLTKIVTFTPFYLLDNRCKWPVEIKEDIENGDWIPVTERQHCAVDSEAVLPTCIGFWPKQQVKRKSCKMRYVEAQQDETPPFPITESFESLLKLPGEFGGINVTVNVSESNVIMTFEDYQDGMAAAMLVNLTEYPVSYVQANEKNTEKLEKQMARMFNWTNVLGKRELVWTCGSKKNNDPLFKDMSGDFEYEKGGDRLFWVSLLIGRQRILLFTDDLAIAAVATSTGFETARNSLQFLCELQGVGLSLVNNLAGFEIAYISITSSGTVWESKKGKKRFKPLSISQNTDIEGAYDIWLQEKAHNSKHPDTVSINEKLQVQFATRESNDEMRLLKPHNRTLKRVFQHAIYLKYCQSIHQGQLHMKLNKIQVDNQISGCVFPVVFAMVPPPKSVAADSVPKPFVELSFTSLSPEASNVPQIPYFMILIQEMTVQADMGFISALLGLVATDGQSQVYGVELFDKDYGLTQHNLTELALASTSVEEKTFWGYLHFSPIMIHLSFSQGGSSGDPAGGGATPEIPMQAAFVSVLLKSVGVTITELQDVVFKLAYFQRDYTFMNKQQLQSEAISHYTKQAIKQFYVLVLGLDVIGNPFGLIRDLGSGVQDLFYEPFQGAVQGPEEFAEGLALGVKSLFGHAVGGAAGAVSRITGTLGKGVAALTFDDEYQKKRQQQINRRPKDFKTGMASGGKGLVMGVYDGVTGVFKKPIEGAKEHGAAGFVKGMGKGLVGLVVRPTSGVIDFASSSLEAVKWATVSTEEVKRIRFARFMPPDNVVVPYDRYSAEGNLILEGVNKGQFVESDVYVTHGVVTKDGRYVAMVTDKRIMMLKKNEVFGAWDCDWDYMYQVMSECPKYCKTDKKQHGIRIPLKEKKKKSFFSSSDSGKMITFSDEKLALFLETRIAEAYQIAMA